MNDMNELRDILLKCHKDDFGCETEKMMFYMKHSKTINEEYWDMLPHGTSIRPHPWDDDEAD